MEDASQNAVIECDLNRLFVEAPAGYGKTYTMIKKIVRDCKIGRIPFPKKALALTFSINAARKMKNDLNSEFKTINDLSLNRDARDRIDVYNYHALARRILSVYSTPVLNNNESISSLSQLNESQISEFFLKHQLDICPEHITALERFAESVKHCDETYLSAHFESYNQVVLDVLLPGGCITYNGIISLAIKILDNCPAVKSLYQNLYTYIIVDESQDTNWLSYQLLLRLISPTTKVNMFGDSLQRIYGFIGALPDFLSRATKDFSLETMTLTVNHRFAAGSSMQLLDLNIRENIRNPSSPSITSTAQVPFFFANTIEEELSATYGIIKNLREKNPEASIAVLLRARGEYSRALPQALIDSGIECFDSLFDEKDTEYSEFNEMCIDLLSQTTNHTGDITLSQLHEFLSLAERTTHKRGYEHAESYIVLLQALFTQVKKELISASPAIKHEFLINVFENKSLNHSISYISDKVILSTMHSAKGLEWDYVIIPELMQWITPSYPICYDCSWNRHLNQVSNRKCKLRNNIIPTSYVDEMCVFYVATTRARQNVFLLASTDRVNGAGIHKPGYLSCFLQMPGIELVGISQFL